MCITEMFGGTMKNPYSLVFGKEPAEHISRLAQFAMVMDSFNGTTDDQQIYLVTGIRGSGKTVFMTDIQNELKKDSDWIVAEINPEKDILTAIAAKLSSEDSLASLFKNAKINLSFWGLGLEVGGVAPITDIEVALSKMLHTIKKHNKKLLITIDEVTNNRYVKEFAAAYQILIRQDLPVYLLMTGLFENVRNLQNEDSLTFLYRAPRIELESLNITSIAANYSKNLKIDRDIAMEMAICTKGYSFAFQVLGYLTWENGGDYKEILPEYRQYLDEFVYDKIWSEVSIKDKTVLKAIAMTESGKIEKVREILAMDSNEFNPYRKRIIDRGLINGKDRGYVRFILPMFREYVIDNS